jgi:extradiol dioxygenase family protein
VTAHPFHLAFPVADLAATRRFYVDLLGCTTGRAGRDWMDIDFFGSQIVAHVLPPGEPVCLAPAGSNRIDGHEVPLPHFGAVLPSDEWRRMAARLREAGADFVIEPHTRFGSSPHEQSSMIFRDPSGNVIELKSFADPSRLFAP